MQRLLHNDIQQMATDQETGLTTKAAEKAPNGYSSLKEKATPHRAMSVGEWDEMQLQESTVVTRVPEQVVKQQLKGDCTAPQPVVS